jgi:hypothetical protein
MYEREEVARSKSTKISLAETLRDGEDIRLAI